MFPFNISEQLLSAFHFFHKGATRREGSAAGRRSTMSGWRLNSCVRPSPRLRRAACSAALGVLCPKSSSSGQNKLFLRTKLIAEEKRTVNFENQKPPRVSLQF